MPLRPLSLSEAIQMGLQTSEVVRILSGSVRVSSVSGFDALIADTRITQQLATFDPEFESGYNGGQINRPPSSFFGPGIETENRWDEGDYYARLKKKWSYGTETSFGYEPSLGYLFFPNLNTSRFNPIYSSDLVMRIEQPLLQQRGKVVNTAPIRIAQIRSGQSRLDVEEALVSQVRSIEEAYWSLHAAAAAVQAVEQVLPLAEESIRIEELRYRAQRTIYADVARARVNLERLKQDRIDLEFERKRREYQLRLLINLPPLDGARLFPRDQPARQAPDLSYDLLLSTALERRQDLQRRRLELQGRELDLAVAENMTLPELQLAAESRASGRGGRLDHALNQMSDYKYRDWTVGLEFSVPLGRRRARAEAEAAELELSRERAFLLAEEQQVGTRMAELLAELHANWDSLQSALKRTEYTRDWLRLSQIRYSKPPPGSGQDGLLLALNDYQQAMRANIDAVSSAAQRLADYNISYARLAEEQGISLDRWQIQFVDSLSPPAATARMFGHGLPIEPVPDPAMSMPMGMASEAARLEPDAPVIHGTGHSARVQSPVTHSPLHSARGRIVPVVEQHPVAPRLRQPASSSRTR